MAKTTLSSTLLLVATLLAAAPLAAQTASQLTQPDYAPPVIRPGGGGLILPQTTGLEAPPGADRLSVTPSGLEVSGGFAEMAPQTAEIAARLNGRRVTAAALFAAASDLEAAYARAGYVLARVSLPPQTIRDGAPLRLSVTRGHVSEIDVSALPARAQGRVRAVLAPLMALQSPTRSDIERRLLLAGDTPGLRMRSTLRAGTAPGATVIVVDGAFDPVDVTLSLGNGISAGYGGYTFGIGLDLNNLAGLGEVTYFRLSGYPGGGGGGLFDGDGLFGDDPRNRQIVLGFTLPLGTDGAWFGLEGVDSRTHPTSDLAFTQVGRYQRLAATLGYNWRRGREANMATELALEMSNETQDIALGGTRTPFTEDRLRVLRLSQTGDLRTRNGILSGRVTLSRGLDAMGARQGSATLPLSRQGAAPDFTSLQAEGRLRHAIAEGLQISLGGKALTSFGDPLVASEQIAIGGFDWLSAFGSGALEGDMGAVLRAEVSMRRDLESGAVKAGLSPYLFAAAGQVVLENPTALERSRTQATSFGLGVRLSLGREPVLAPSLLSLEYAHGTVSGGADEDRFNVSLVAQF